MALAGAWLLYPAVAVLTCLGWGLLVDRAAAGAVPGALLVPTGVAALVAATGVTVASGALAPLTLPVAVVGALAGWALGLRRLRTCRPDPWLVVAAVGVFAVFGAPVVLSGEATFAGYTVLGDTAIHFLGADVLLDHGRDVTSLPPSSYAAATQAYYGPEGSGYPTGGAALAGVLTSLVHQDVAWTFQPLLSLLAALIVPCLWFLLDGAGFGRRVRAAAAFVAAQPAIAVAHALQGSIKEIATAFVVALLAALVAAHVREAVRSPALAVARSTVPVLVASAAAVAFIGLAAGAWVAPLALAAFLALWRGPRVGWTALGFRAAVFAVGLAVLGYGALTTAGDYVQVTKAVVTSQVEFGNLLGRPLLGWQAVGIWPTGDHRLLPAGAASPQTFVLIGVALVAVALGLAHLIRRRAWPPLLYAAVSVLAWIYISRSGSPWADAKALMIVSPAVLLLAVAGAASLMAGRRLAESAALGTTIAFGVLWSNALAYHDVALAPRDRLSELQRISDRFAGRGPALVPEFEEFAKHFARRLQPDSPVEAWRAVAPVPAVDRPEIRFGFSADLDDLDARYVGRYRLIVLRRGFAVSRPGSAWVRRFRGRYYDVWERAKRSPKVVLHAGLGAAGQASAVAPCRRVRALARRAARTGAHLRVAERPPALVADLAQAQLPANWLRDSFDAAVIHLVGPGHVTVPVTVRRAGRYELWFEGSAARSLAFEVDGRAAGELAGALNNRGGADPVAVVHLESGRHDIQLTRSGGTLAPGNGFQNDRLIAIALEPVAAETVEVRTVRPADVASVCGRPLDWMEIVRSDGVSTPGA